MLHEETFSQTVDVPYNFLNINNKPCLNFAGIKCNICTDINGNNNKGYNCSCIYLLINFCRKFIENL